MRVRYVVLTVFGTVIVLGIFAMSENAKAFDMRNAARNAPMYQPHIAIPKYGFKDDSMAGNLKLNRDIIESKYQDNNKEYSDVIVDMISSLSAIGVLFFMWLFHRIDRRNLQNQMAQNIKQHREQMDLRFTQYKDQMNSSLEQHKEHMTGINNQIRERDHYRKVELLTESMKYAAKNVIYYSVNNGIFGFRHREKNQEYSCLIKWSVEHFPGKKIFTVYCLLDSKSKVPDNIFDICGKLWWNFDISISVFDDGEYGSMIPSIRDSGKTDDHPNQKYFSEMKFNEYLTIRDGIQRIQVKSHDELKKYEKATCSIKIIQFHLLTPKANIKEISIMRSTIFAPLVDLSSIRSMEDINFDFIGKDVTDIFSYLMPKSRVEVYIDIPYLLYNFYIDLSSIYMKEIESSNSLFKSNYYPCLCNMIVKNIDRPVPVVAWLFKV